MSDNPKITLDLKEYLQGMEKRLLEDSKMRHGNHQEVTKTNFKSLEGKFSSLKWTISILLVVVGLVVAYVQYESNDAPQVIKIVTVKE